MPKMKFHINNFRRILLMWFVLFSLSPCTVKEVLFYSLNTDYSKPLNKSKTSTQTSSCSYSQNEKQQISAAKKTRINKQIEPVDSFDKAYLTGYVAKDYNNYSKTSSGNSPPKYILYKRLKIDIA